MKFIKGSLTYVLLISLIALQVSNTKAAINCVQCSGTTCKDTISELSPSPCAEGPNQCFTKFDASGTISRGCVTDNTCTADNNCVLSNPGLNNQLICKTCDTATDAACSQTDMKDNSAKYLKICDATQTKCLMSVKDKKVQRGCATDAEVTACSDATTCSNCATVNCNVGIFPANRISCYQCSDAACNAVSTTTVNKPCLNYVANDQCYTKGESDTTMKRGCQSDDTSNDCTDATKTGCQFCSASQCNSLSYKRDQKLKCYQCTGTECFKEQTATEFTACKEQLLYTETDSCYTHVEGGTIERGCLHDNAKLTAETCKDDEVCTKCSDKDGCNSKAVTQEFTCLVCRSDEEPKCWNDAASLTGKACRTNPSSAEEGCFHGIWNGVAIRGCYVDANQQQQAVCKDAQSLQCNWCSGTNCNKEKSSGASTINMFVGFWFMILTTLWYFK